MCGIFGVIPKSAYINKSDQQVLRELFYFLCMANQARGDHSWGIWFSMGTLKNTGAIMTGMKHIRDYVSRLDFNTSFLAGHTRHATHGDRTTDNAHPFRFESEDGNTTFRLAHNGVVTVDGYGAKDHPVDSGRIGLSVFDQILKMGDQETLIDAMKRGLEKVSGSCALAMSVNKELFLYKHSQQLALFELENAFIFSSADDHARKALAYLGIPAKALTIKEDTICRFENDVAMLHNAPAKAYTSAYTDWDGTTRSCGYNGKGSDYYRNREWVRGENGVYSWQEKKPIAPIEVQGAKTPMLFQKSGSIPPSSPSMVKTEDQKTADNDNVSTKETPADEAIELTCDACGSVVSNGMIFDMEDVDPTLSWFFTYELVCSACCADLELWSDATLASANKLSSRLEREGKTIVGSGRVKQVKKQQKRKKSPGLSH